MENTNVTTAKRGRPQTKNANAETKPTIDYEEIIKAQNNTIEELKNMILEMKKSSMNDKSNVQNVQHISYTSMMDRPCTLIHLWDCVPGLPTTIYVRDVPYQFTKFGERKIFRFEDIQIIISRYRDFFNRGVFTLGSDCDEFKENLGVDLTDIPMSANKYNHIAELPHDEFESIIHNLNMNQKIILAKTWVNRFSEGKPGYDDMVKISFINKETDGFLDNFIQKDMRDF